ncbi:hypothetical protein [Nocardioides jejuensis]|uniref:Universal stress protein n=1 Tax=Nocardioides jejuensis TaxID=2502782 RepID=A0A4V2NZD3_9ACTN|nr:hypothetical protein [Nocardioides jejuensis]TCJ28582.1 hypothetical protein EPD65_07685 [Nocardioides jejuensis]
MAATGPTYDVVLLAEQALSEVDAQEVIALHEELETDQRVKYHVLIPVEDAAARVEATLGALGAGENVAIPSYAYSDLDIAEVREECLQRSKDALATSLELLRAGGVEAEGTTVEEPPISALVSAITTTDGREAIILTRPHLVAEFFHLDWTSKARRKLDVPVLHLLEHESIVEQSAGGGEGISGV